MDAKAKEEFHKIFGGGGFNAGPQDEYARNMTWGLFAEPHIDFLPIGAPSAYGDQYEMRTTPETGPGRYSYVHNGPQGRFNELFVGAWVDKIQGRLFRNIRTGQTYWNVRMLWWCSSRTQRPFQYGLTIFDSLNSVYPVKDANPDFIPVKIFDAFIIDCQCTQNNSAWLHELPPVPVETMKIGLPQDDFFETARFLRIIMPGYLAPDHGPICR
jgi:hypothetical protein